MLQIHTFCLGDYQTNCYCVRRPDSSDCIIIDPGYEPELLLSYLREEKLTLAAVLLTHGHFDHVGGVRALAAATHCRVYLHAAEHTMPPMLTAGKLYCTDTYADGETFTEAGLTFTVLHTPGHTPGSVCLLCENELFSGDTLFAGSCGRTDLPGGDARAMRDSLRRLATLPDKLAVHPGHGAQTSIALERVQNPYL